MDGKELVDLSSWKARNKYGTSAHQASNPGWVTSQLGYVTHPPVKEEERTPGHLIEYGELSRFDLSEACWAYLSMNIDDALTSDHPLIIALAMLDRRVGKRKLRELNQAKMHPLAKALLELRLKAEGVV